MNSQLGIIVLILISQHVWCNISSECNLKNNGYTEKLCELYREEVNDWNKKSQTLILARKYEIALILQKNLKKQFKSTNSFVEDVVKHFEPSRVNLPEVNTDLSKYMMKNSIYLSSTKNATSYISQQRDKVFTLVYEISSNSKTWIKEISEFGAIDSESIWFVHGNLSFLDPSSQILLSSNFYLFDIYESYIVVNEVYRKANDLPLISKIWGIWSPAIGLVYNEAFIWSRRRDLNGVKLKCATLPYSPHIFTGPINGMFFISN